MKEIDLVPPDKRTPQQHERTALVHQYQDRIEAAIADTAAAGHADFSLDNTVVLLLDKPTKDALWPQLPEPTSDALPDYYILVGPRAGFRTYFEKAFPGSEMASTHAMLAEPPPAHHVYVVIAAFGGVTLTAMSIPPPANMAAPNSPNN